VTELETKLADALRRLCWRHCQGDHDISTRLNDDLIHALEAYDAAKSEEDIIKSHCPTCDGTCRYQDHMEEYDK
jgi:hypothetical protein